MQIRLKSADTQKLPVDKRVVLMPFETSMLRKASFQA